MYLKEKYKNNIEYYTCIKELIETPVVLQMNQYIQHGNTTCLSHCLSVSYKSYIIAKKLNLDYEAVARAALLHDLFLYDWHKKEREKHLFQKHGFTHPKLALENALKYFELSEKEKDIIIKHMWPLTLRQVPKYKESILVSIIDKYSSTSETIIYILKIIFKNS